MRWVKLPLPPRERRRRLLMTTRLSMRSLAGTARTLVAVGTDRLDSMLVTTRAAGPRSVLTSSSFTGPVDLTGGTSRGVGLAASAAFASTEPTSVPPALAAAASAPVCAGVGVGRAGAAGAAGAGAEAAGAAGAGAGAMAGLTGRVDVAAVPRPLTIPA